MDDKKNTRPVYPSSRFRFIDGLVLVIFLSTAFYGLYLFRQDLLQTFEIRDAKPAGIITIRKNVVQRRHEDRALWDRIFVNSLVYPGDLIRVAEVSSTNVDISANDLFLNENTLIRIGNSMDASGSFLVELQQGNLSVTSGAESSGITLDFFGNQVKTQAGTQLDLEANEEGISLQVNEGKIEFKAEGQEEAREITEGSAVAFDTQGKEMFMPSISVRRPIQNARYLNDNPQELYLVKFEWNKVEIDESAVLRLELSGDYDFKNIIHMFESRGNRAEASFDIGQWYWRLLHDGKIVRKGYFNIVDASGAVLISPVPDTVFRYHGSSASTELPVVRFQWETKEWASSYLIEISKDQDFTNPFVRKQIYTNSFITSELGEGSWYWRVKPVFNSAFIGSGSFSADEPFVIEKTNDPKASAVFIPAEAVKKARDAIAGVFSSVRSVRSERRTSVSVSSNDDTATVTNASNIETAAGVKLAGRIEYTIRAGDTLGRISRRYYGDPLLWTIIVEANNIKNPDLIYPGQVYIIP